MAKIVVEEIGIKELGIEETFKLINESIEKLENGDLSLENSFEEYQKGMSLIKAVTTKIDDVEKKVLAISEEGEIDEFE